MKYELYTRQAAEHPIMGPLVLKEIKIELTTLNNILHSKVILYKEPNSREQDPVYYICHLAASKHLGVRVLKKAFSGCRLAGGATIELAMTRLQCPFCMQSS